MKPRAVLVKDDPFNLDDEGFPNDLRTPEDLETFLETYSQNFNGFLKYFPHYALVARPLYKLLNGNKWPFFSVPITFAVMEYLFHQLLFNIYGDYRADKISLDTFMLLPNPFPTLAWTALSIPVALHKHMQNKKPKKTQSTHTPALFAPQPKKQRLSKKRRDKLKARNYATLSS